VAVSEPGEIRRDLDAVAAPTYREGLTAALAAFFLTLAAALLGLALRVGGLAIVWPAAGVVTGLCLIASPRLRPAVLAGAALGLLIGNLIAGRAIDVSLMFLVANLAEALLVTALLERWIGKPVRLETLPQVGFFVLAASVAMITVGFAGSLYLAATPAVGFDFARNFTWWITSRGLGTLAVAPAIIALGAMSRAAMLTEWRLGRPTLGAIVVLGVVTYLTISTDLWTDSLLGLLVLLAVTYPVILWIAATREPVWTYLSLLLVAILVVWRLGHGGGLFQGATAAAQAFLFVSSLWALTLAVVMRQQRVAMGDARRSEQSVQHALAAGRGFTFDFDPKSDYVRRTDPDLIIAPFTAETGTSFFERVLPDDRTRLQQCVESLSPVRPMYELAYGSRRPDGKLVWLQERGVGEFNEHGALVRLQGLTMDVTVRREAEEALREADRKKDRFIATLAHELRNPLAPIRTAADMLGSARAGPEQVAWASKVIQRQVGHMAHLLDDLLDVARITRGKLEIRKQQVRLESIVEAAVEVARPLLDARQQRLQVSLPQPAPLLDADPVRLAQVVSNLLNNAAKYSEPGGEIRLSASTRDSIVELKVADDGMGIPPEALEHVFAMFSQVETATGRSEGGLGIGLSLVKGLVELHGGSVTACSEGIGKGSEFVVTLPYMPQRDGHALQNEPRAAASAPAGSRILVVDDNRDAADSLALLLGLDGHEVRVAYAGRPAIEAAHSFQPRIVILDLGLPDLSGYDVARLMRQDPAVADALLIALTGWGQEEHKQHAMEAGFDHHTTKPVDLEHLAVLLGTHATRDIGGRGSRGETATPA
jgi:signal transduction histidine kinase/ActR/RegA family two-component response regulator